MTPRITDLRYHTITFISPKISFQKIHVSQKPTSYFFVSLSLFFHFSRHNLKTSENFAIFDGIVEGCIELVQVDDVAVKGIVASSANYLQTSDLHILITRGKGNLRCTLCAPLA